MLESIYILILNTLITIESFRLHYVARFKAADPHIDTVLKRAGYQRVNGFTWMSGPFRARLTQCQGTDYRMQLTIVRPE